MTEVLALREQNKEMAEMCNSGIPERAKDMFRPPEVKLIQPMTTGALLVDGNEAKAGEYYHTAKQVAHLPLDLTILGFRMEGAHWVDTNGDGEGDTIQCRSNNGIVSTEGSSLGGGGKPCAICEHNQWVEKKKPACTLSFVFMCLDGDEDPFLLRVKGVSFNAARKFVGTCVGARKPLFAYKVALESKLIEADRRKYYIVVFRRGEMRPFEEIVALSHLAGDYSSDPVSTGDPKEAPSSPPVGAPPPSEAPPPPDERDVGTEDVSPDEIELGSGGDKDG